VISTAIVIIVELAMEGDGFAWQYVVLGLIVAVDVPLIFMVFSLVSFHIFLCCKRISTYEYLTGKVSRRTKLRRESAAQAAAAKKARRVQGPSVPICGGGLLRSQCLVKKPTVEWGTVMSEGPVMDNSLPPVVTTPKGLAAQAQSVTREDSSDSSSSSSSSSESEREHPGLASVADTVFSNFIADEVDPPLKKAMSSVIFGSGITSEGPAADMPTSIFPGLVTVRSPGTLSIPSQGCPTSFSPQMGGCSLGSNSFGSRAIPLASMGHQTMLVQSS